MLLDPGVEGRPPSGRDGGCAGHRPTQTHGKRLRVAGQRDDGRRRQVSRDGDDGLVAGPARGLLGQQEPKVVHPGIAARAAGPPSATSSASRSGSEPSAARRARIGSCGHDVRDGDREVRVGGASRLPLSATSGSGAGAQTPTATTPREPGAGSSRRKRDGTDSVFLPVLHTCVDQEHLDAGPGERDIGEATLLGDGVAPPPSRTNASMAALRACRSLGAAPVEVGQSVAVAAQVVGQRVEPDEPALVLGDAGADVLDRSSSCRRRRRPRSSRGRGTTPSTSAGTATTSHSSPLAAWTVSTWTASASVSVCPASSPRSCSRAASSQLRKPAERRAVGSSWRSGRRRRRRRRGGPAPSTRCARGAPAPRCRARCARSASATRSTSGQRGEAAQAPDDVAEVVQAVRGPRH